MISLSLVDNGNPRSSVGSAVVIISVFATLLGSASGEYGPNGLEKFASRSLDGNANGLCSGSNCAERGGGVSGAMWFGPRLGRRRRSEEKSEGFEDDQINAIADALEESPWAFVPVQGDKRHANQFTPRLGRESGEDLMQKYILMSENARLGRLMDGRQEEFEQRQAPPPPPPPFAPRLGRRLTFTSSPRFSRQLRTLLQKL